MTITPHISKRPDPYYISLRKHYDEYGENLSFPLFKGYGTTEYMLLKEMSDEYLSERIKNTYYELENTMNINTTLYETFIFILESEMSIRLRKHKIIKLKNLITNGNNC